MEKVLRNITGVYYIIYMLTILSAIAVFVLSSTGQNHQTISQNSQSATVLSSILYLYVLISVPLVLWWFHKNTKKWQLLTDKYEKYNAYKKASHLRLWIVGIGLIAGVVIFYLLQSTSIIYCALISAVALFFCKPSENKMIKELDLEEDE